MSDETKKKKLPKLPNGMLRLYVTRNGKAYQPQVTWDLLLELGVPAEPTRLKLPGLELAQKALVKLKSQILTERRTGLVEASRKNKIKDLFVLAEMDYARQGRKTVSHVKSRWKNHLKGYFGDLPANGLTSDDVDNYIFARQKEGAGPATINRETAIVRRLLNLGMGTKPPKVANVPKFTHLKEPDPRTGFLDQADYDKLRACAKELWLRGWLAAAYVFGFRKSELLRLRVRQVNLLDETIDLPAGATKNGKARTVVMTREVLTLITARVQGKQPADYVLHSRGRRTREGLPRRVAQAVRRRGTGAAARPRHAALGDSQRPSGAGLTATRRRG